MAPACQAAGLEGFPTWVIGEQRLKGEQSFEKLEAALEKAVEDVAALAVVVAVAVVASNCATGAAVVMEGAAR